MKSWRLQLGLFLLVCAIFVVAIPLYYYRTRGAATALQEQGVDDGVVRDAVPAVQLTTTGLDASLVRQVRSPKFVSVGQGSSGLNPAGSGIVVRQGTLVRFYPYQIMRLHEVVEDTVGATALAVTFCELCNVGAVYERTIDGQQLHFRVSNKLDGYDLLLEDEQTGTVWSQVTGQALQGRLAGAQLRAKEHEVISLADFVTRYPYGQVMQLPVGLNYEVLSYGDAEALPNAEQYIATNRLVHPKTTVLGVVLAGVPYAVVLENEVKKPFVVRLGGVRATVFTGADGTIGVRNQSGLDLPSTQTYWFLWELHFPQTEIAIGV